MKKKSDFLTNILLIVLLFFFEFGALCFSGVSLSFVTRKGTSEQIITTECKTRESGSVFATIDYVGTLEEDRFNAEKEGFDNYAGNVLQKATTGITFTIDSISDKAMLINTGELINEYYNEYYMYSDSKWNDVTEKENGIVIPQSIAREIVGSTAFHQCVGKKAHISNGLGTIEVEITGYYYETTSLKGKDQRGYQMNKTYDHPIFVNPKILETFKSNCIFAMFTSTSTNNGKKYIQLEKLAEFLNSTVQMDFSKNAESKLAMIWETAMNDDRSSLLIVPLESIILSVIILLAILSFVKDLTNNTKKWNKKNKIVFESTFYASSLFITLLLLRLLRNKSITYNFANLMLISRYSVFLIFVFYFIKMIYFATKNKEIINIFKPKKQKHLFEKKENKEINTPVCLFTWQRYEQPLKIIEVLKKANVKNIYVMSDGGRNEQEWKNVNEARAKIKEALAWNKNVKYIFADKNKGVFKTIGLGALDIFEKEEQCIFLEDDNLPTVSFFEYCETLLAKYRDNEKVFMICGTNYIKDGFETNDDYMFVQALLPCGWASWSNKFKKHYNYDLSYFDDEENKNEFIKKYRRKALGKQQLESIVNERELYKKTGAYRSWDYQLIASIMRDDLYVISPRLNQITNIGVDEYSIHDVKKIGKKNPMTRRFCEVKSYELKFPLNDPKEIKINKSYQRTCDKKILFSLSIRLKRILLKVIKNK